MDDSGRDRSPDAPGRVYLGKRAAVWIILGYPLLYAVGFLARPFPAPAALWPAHALTFFAYLTVPFRFWPVVALAMIAWDFTVGACLHFVAGVPAPTLVGTGGFALANILTGAGPALLVRLMRLFRAQARTQLIISPLWILALFVGVLPGAILGGETRAQMTDHPLVLANVALWVFASVLSIGTFGPAVFGTVVGFSEPAPAAARRWEGFAVAVLVLALFSGLLLVTRPLNDELLEPTLFTVSLVWLALRFSRRATSIGVVIVASGIVLLTGRGPGAHSSIADLNSWRAVVISIEIFLLTGCGGALLVNLMTLNQRALLTTLAREHAQLRMYARALDIADETARRATAADLHDGIGQILAGQSMTLAAMRPHATNARLSALVEEAADASREAQAAVRVMIQDLSPPELEHASLNEALDWLASLFRARYGFTVNSLVTGTAELPPEKLQLVFRCVRELLMNARKHSEQHCAEVEIHCSERALEATVIDDGVGFDAARIELFGGNRFGLAQLRERVHAAGGSVEIDAAVGGGCRVSVRLPTAAAMPA